MPPLPRVNKKERRAQIIAAAIKEFGTSGFTQTSMEQISREVGISKPILYQFFKSKEELYLAVLTEICDEIIAGMNSSNQVTGDTLERVTYGVRIFFGLVKENKNLVNLFFNTDSLSTKVNEHIEQMLEKISDSAAKMVLHVRKVEENNATLLGKIIVTSVLAAAKHTDFENPEHVESTLHTASTLIAHGLEAFPTNQP